MSLKWLLGFMCFIPLTENSLNEAGSWKCLTNWFHSWPWKRDRGEKRPVYDLLMSRWIGYNSIKMHRFMSVISMYCQSESKLSNFRCRFLCKVVTADIAGKKLGDIQTSLVEAECWLSRSQSNESLSQFLVTHVTTELYYFILSIICLHHLRK